MFANTPKPPYYAVIFTNTLSDQSLGYEQMADKMLDLASKQDGFLGAESVRDRMGITISYWRDLEAVKSWKANAEHQKAQELGRSTWYTSYKTRIAKIERDYSFENE